MPISTSYRGSTQDNANGVQVAQATVEVSGAGVLVTGVNEGNKTTYANTPTRTGITTNDTTTTDLSTSGFAGGSGANLVDLGNALNVCVRVSCSVASATLNGRLIYYDGSNNPIAYSENMTFVSDSTVRLSAAGDYISQHYITDVGEARKVRFYITSVSTGTWAIYVRPI